MEQHAIPQQINSYEFKLVGDMTLKQFMKAAVGVVLALLINSSKLIFFLKYPLVAICGGGGLVLAFVPFQDRPLEKWIFSFLSAIYSPTIYIYKKSVDQDWASLGKGKNVETKEEEDVPVPVKDNSKVREFIESLSYVDRDKKEIEYKEETTTETTPELQKTTKFVKPEMAVEVEKEYVQEKDWRDEKANLGLKSEVLAATGTAVFGEIPMPDKPDVPNMVVGMVTDLGGKIIEGAIVEIQDEKGNPSRVLKTNPLGQFRTTTPLANGKYLVITEKEDFGFDRVNINLAGALVDPIKIQAVT